MSEFALGFDQAGISIFSKLIGQSNVYGEYGCGSSTVFAHRHSNCKIFAVDSSPEWAHQVRGEMLNDTRAIVSHVDMGPVSDWGWPESLEFAARFRDYFDFPWNHSDKPDLVLIDGRFRVACFATSALRALPGTIILFDDYGDRTHYHVVETVIPLKEMHGRMGLFVVPPKLDRAYAGQLLDEYMLVRE